jgi:putative transposase
MRTIKDECLNRMIFFGEPSLRKAVHEFLVHYHSERNHHGMANRNLVPGKEVGRMQGGLRCRQRLGGMLRYYYREAA